MRRSHRWRLLFQEQAARVKEEEAALAAEEAALATHAPGSKEEALAKIAAGKNGVGVLRGSPPMVRADREVVLAAAASTIGVRPSPVASGSAPPGRPPLASTARCAVPAST